jgi:hypothetical protein
VPVTEQDGSREEAVAAAVHAHHPEDSNRGVVRATLGPHAVLAGLLATAVTVAGIVALAIAVGGR